MIYAAELFYLQDQRNISFQEAVRVTATTITQWCTYFRARLLSPKQHVGLIERRGQLPMPLSEKKEFVAELIQWLFDHSEVEDLFCLFLDDRPVPQAGRVAKFHHPDDTCCWFLHLTEDEFAVLRDSWRENNLPVNLFYPEQEMRCIPYPGRGLKAKVLRVLGVQKCYTPMQWQAELSPIKEAAG